MSELVIKTHEFETAKNRLRDFSQNLPKDLEIDRVATDGGFLGLGDHKVTGYELNRRLSTIQDHLISLNDTNKDTIKEFRQVYNALEALDKDYIQAILISVKATEKASERLEKDNERINKLQGNQTKTLGILLDFKKKIDAYKHLGDIDTIWADCQKWHEEIPTLLNSLSGTILTVEANTKTIGGVKKSLGATYDRVEQISVSLNEEIERIKALTVFVEGMEAMAHLREIDTMFDSLSSAHNSLNELRNELGAVEGITNKHQQDIEKALAFVATVSQYEHLKDVDTLWASNETHSEEIKALQEQGEDARKLIQQNKDLADQSLADEKARIDTVVQSLNKKIQYAYWVAGGSMALALIELFVILLG